MQPIERYGLVALVFLGITITAACLWEPEEDPAAPDGTAAARVAHAAGDAESAREIPTGGRDFVGARSSQTQRAKPKGLSAAQRQELLALQGRQGEPRPGAGQPGRGALGDAFAAQRPPGTAAASPPATREVAAAERPAGDPPRAASTPKPLARPKAAPEGDRRVYTIRANDTLSEIASAELGTWKRWQEIVDLNPGLDPNKLREGARIVLPADAAGAATPAGARPAAAAPQAAKAKGPVHVVAEDESLWKIAAARLGSGERWSEIAKLNPSIDPDRLSPGMKLVLPFDAAAVDGAGRTSGSAVAQATPERPAGRVR